MSGRALRGASSSFNTSVASSEGVSLRETTALLGDAERTEVDGWFAQPRRSSSAVARAAAEAMHVGDKRARRSNVGEEVSQTARYCATSTDVEAGGGRCSNNGGGKHQPRLGSNEIREHEKCRLRRLLREEPWYTRAAGQIPAVALICLLNLMLSIPFGVSYFPINWRAATDALEGNEGGAEDGVNGLFPIQGKEALGIRMFLFSTIVGQIVFAFASKFKNAVGCQMVENVPFCHSLASIVIAEQGYGMESLSTLFFLFGFASVVVGIVFYVLGKLELGRIIYFFPSHVLIGCIGGIGVFMAATGMEVAMNTSFSFSIDGIKSCVENYDLLGIALAFEIVLRILMWITTDKNGKPRYPLLSPIYFCMITPIFYMGLWIFRIDINDAEDAGYFFPSPDGCDPDKSFWERIFNEDLWEIWSIVDTTTISWTAVVKSLPTLTALACFSLIHVPINIPAFAISTNVEADMNAELIAHGYSNTIAGILGGLQNYMTYSNSVVFARSGGEGKASSLTIAFFTGVFFVIGPSIAMYIPRCMAGTLLFHIGIDLFVEGVYESYEDFDLLEYSGIWLIVVVMTVYGMSAALVAGVISALSTYAVQSVTYLNPVRRKMTAATLRSSSWYRRPEAFAILDSDKIGRKKILVIQLQGHLFFGNVASLTDSLKQILAEKKGTDEEPWIVILDFSLVLGIDSSAAQAVTKLQGVMRNTFDVGLTIFVTGSKDGFPCDYGLSRKLSCSGDDDARDSGATVDLRENVDLDQQNTDGNDESFKFTRRSVADVRGSMSIAETDLISPGTLRAAPKFPTNQVCHSLDSALIFSEDVLIAREDPNLLDDDTNSHPCIIDDLKGKERLLEEKKLALHQLSNHCPGQDVEILEIFFSRFEREVYEADQIVWRQGCSSDCVKLLVCGTLVSSLEDEAGTSEHIPTGNIFGELGLVLGTKRLSTVRCLSALAVIYSLSRASWEDFNSTRPEIGRLVDRVAIHYLTHRVHHVSNRIFETRCLPV